jgi:hypothetical protein
MKSEDIQRLKASLQLKADIDAVVTGEGRVWADIKKVMDKLPAQQMVNAIQYLERQILPSVKKRSGESSPDYKFFSEVIELLEWSALIYDRCGTLRTMHASIKIENALLLERLKLYENELNKYTTIEDIYITDSLGHIEKGILARLESKLGTKKR